MGTVYRKQTTRPLPVGAELFTKRGQRFARWKAGKRTRTEKLTTGRDGTERIVTESPTFLAKYRDGQGIVCEVSTGCKDETAARAVLAELEKRAEKVRAGIITKSEDAMTVHQHTPLTDHVAEFIASMRAAGRSETHVTGTERLIQRIIDESGFRRLPDIQAGAVERWLAQQTLPQEDKATMGARTRNSYLVALGTFCNWCVERDRLPFNPLAKLEKADERSDRRRQRRALTEAELSRLLIVTRLRPLAEYGRETMPKPDDPTKMSQKRRRASWTYKPLTFDGLNAAVGRAHERLKESPEFIAQLERLGQERELIYKVAVTTGLRKSEIASLTVGQLDLDRDCPQVTLNAADEKNRQGNSLPLRSDVADKLRMLDFQNGSCRTHANVARIASAVRSCPSERSKRISFAQRSRFGSRAFGCIAWMPSNISRASVRSSSLNFGDVPAFVFGFSESSVDESAGSPFTLSPSGDERESASEPESQPELEPESEWGGFVWCLSGASTVLALCLSGACTEFSVLGGSGIPFDRSETCGL